MCVGVQEVLTYMCKRFRKYGYILCVCDVCMYTFTYILCVLYCEVDCLL